MSIQLGPRSYAAYLYVLRNPGCCKLAVAEHVGPNSSRKYGYRTVDRLIASGAIKIGGCSGGKYTLYAAVAPADVKTKE